MWHKVHSNNCQPQIWSESKFEVAAQSNLTPIYLGKKKQFGVAHNTQIQAEPTRRKNAIKCSAYKISFLRNCVSYDGQRQRVELQFKLMMIHALI